MLALNARIKHFFIHVFKDFAFSLGFAHEIYLAALLLLVLVLALHRVNFVFNSVAFPLEFLIYFACVEFGSVQILLVC